MIFSRDLDNTTVKSKAEQDIQVTLNGLGMDNFFITMATEITDVIDNKDDVAVEHMKFG